MAKDPIVEEVREAAREALARARAGAGPTFIECSTHRFEGHYFGEPQVYRTREEVEELRKSRDPIVLFEDYLVEEGLAELEILKALVDEATRDIQEALDFAEESPDPAPDSFEEYVYA